MDIKAIAMKVAMDTGLYLDGANQSEPLYVIKPEEVVEFATALLAEIQKQNEPVYFEWRHCDTSNDPKGIWSEWKKVEPRNAYVNTVEDSVAEFDAYIVQGYRYELRKLYTFPPSVEAIENKVAEACGELVLSGAHDDDPFIISEMIANGEWRKHMKGE